MKLILLQKSIYFDRYADLRFLTDGITLSTSPRTTRPLRLVPTHTASSATSVLTEMADANDNGAASISDNVPAAAVDDPFVHVTEHDLDTEVAWSRWDITYDEEGNPVDQTRIDVFVIVMYNVTPTNVIFHPILWEKEWTVATLLREATSQVKAKLARLAHRRRSRQPLQTRHGFGTTTGVVVWEGPFSHTFLEEELIDLCIAEDRVTIQHQGTTIFGSALDG